MAIQFPALLQLLEKRSMDTQIAVRKPVQALLRTEAESLVFKGMHVTEKKA